MELFKRRRINQENEALELALEYSEDPDKLKKIIKGLQISIKFNGVTKHFESDAEERLVGNFEIYKEEGQKFIDFDFGFSLSDTYAHFPQLDPKFNNRKINRNKEAIKFNNGLLYSVLCSIRSDFYISDTFADFCLDFGYNEDSRSAHSVFERCLDHKRLLQTIFTEDEVECFPS